MHGALDKMKVCPSVPTPLFRFFFSHQILFTIRSVCLLLSIILKSSYCNVYFFFSKNVDFKAFFISLRNELDKLAKNESNGHFFAVWTFDPNIWHIKNDFFMTFLIVIKLSMMMELLPPFFQPISRAEFDPAIGLMGQS